MRGDVAACACMCSRYRDTDVVAPRSRRKWPLADVGSNPNVELGELVTELGCGGEPVRDCLAVLSLLLFLLLSVRTCCFAALLLQ